MSYPVFPDPTTTSTSERHGPRPSSNEPDCVFSQLIPELRKALSDSGYTTPTPVQDQCIPHLVAGRDLLGSAQTGTGKTAAFTLPLLQYVTRHPRKLLRCRPRVLVLAPTRELAAQIGESVRTYGRHLNTKHTVIFGGVGQRPQEAAMRNGVDFLVATPGRLLDLMGQGHVRLDDVEAFVLDEADRMLDMGFIHDVRKIIAKLPPKRQSLFFSATLSPDVVALANGLLSDPARVTIAPEQPTVERIEQRLMYVDKGDKDRLLAELLAQSGWTKVIVFTQMKHVANRVADKLQKAGVTAEAIHGNKSQGARTRALEGFRSGKVRALVATDIAARGIDVDGITHVINHQLPIEPETYVHRIGRTARAGTDGDAVSFCSGEEQSQLRAIERLLRRTIPVATDHAFHSETAANANRHDSSPGHREGRNAAKAKFSNPANGSQSPSRRGNQRRRSRNRSRNRGTRS